MTTLAACINAYIQKRRSEGSPFVSSENTLRAFLRFCGPIELCQLTAPHVTAFLEHRETKQVTRLSKFSAVKCFCDAMGRAGAMDRLTLNPPAKSSDQRAPFVYTVAQVRALLRNADRCQAQTSVLSGESFRMLILVLYGTGASLGEVLALEQRHVDIRRGFVVLASSGNKPERSIPLGKTLRSELRRFLPTGKSQTGNELVFRRESGAPLSRHHVCGRFRRLSLLAGVSVTSSPAPRLQDFRYTFAVHTLRAWLQSRKEPAALTPALSTYMGYADLNAAERFLAFTPERFRAALEVLSPGTSTGRPRI